MKKPLNKIAGNAGHLAVYFSDEQLKWIEARAIRRDCSKGAVVRDIIAAYMAARSKRAAEKAMSETPLLE